MWECIEEARADGTIVQGGNRPAINGRRTFIDPTIIINLPADHRLYSHEIFGPVALVTPFDSEEEAIARANETPYGLAAALWTGSMARAHRVSARLVAGTVSVNTVDALGFTTPFGDSNSPGFGRDLRSTLWRTTGLQDHLDAVGVKHPRFCKTHRH